MHLEEVKVAIDVLDQARVLRHQMNGSYPTTVHRWRLLPRLVVDVIGFEHRLGLVLPVLGFETTLDSLLAVAQYLGIGSIHSKCLVTGCWRLLNTCVSSNTDGHFELLVQTSPNKSRFFKD
jgi:hypothetical protein